jgi:hypothetical protein
MFNSSIEIHINAHPKTVVLDGVAATDLVSGAGLSLAPLVAIAQGHNC